MKKIIFLLLTVSILSCSKSEIESELDCGSAPKFGETKETRDILKKFKLIVPKNWSTQLYYDDFKSQIYAADTSKQLTETYILDVAWHQGELTVNDALANSVKDTLNIKEKMTTVKSGFGKFKKKPSYWNLSQGKESGRLYTFLQLYLKTEPDEYFLLTTKLYGDKNVDARICESIALFDKVKIIE